MAPPATRFLVLSDIHANGTALDAVLEAAAARWDRAVCLGDLVGYGPDPNEVIERIRTLGATAIRGNHDKAGCGLDEAEDFNDIARQAVMWTRQQLHPENRDYLRKLPAGPLEVDGVVLVHGSLHDEDEYVFAPAQALPGLLDAPTPVCFFGHTHFQSGFSFRDGKLEVLHLHPASTVQFTALRIEPGTRYLLNPGSVGQPRDGDPRAAFAIADLVHHVVEFWRVPYDVRAVQQRMRRAGLPEPLVLRLSHGR
ncbi:MAG: metallophosphatase family protein [Acidobacteriia bacterium]|nr:metallophosphatase family protein [Terriglobia bacterium]